MEGRREMSDKCSELPGLGWDHGGEEKAQATQLLSDGDQSASAKIQIATSANTLSQATNEVGRESCLGLGPINMQLWSWTCGHSTLYDGSEQQPCASSSLVLAHLS